MLNKVDVARMAHDEGLSPRRRSTRSVHAAKALNIDVDACTIRKP